MTDEKKNSTEFMLAYYQVIYQRYLYEREVGEKRLNIFLTLASAITAGLLLLLTTNPSQVSNPHIVLIVGLGILLLLGIVTFERIRARGVSCVSWLIRANRVLKYFIDKDIDLEKYVKPHGLNELSEDWKRSLRLGSLVQTMAVLNTIVAVAISITLMKFLWLIQDWFIVIAIIIISVIVWLLHVFAWRSGLRHLRSNDPFSKLK